MLSALCARFDYGGLPPALRRYVAVVTAIGFAAPLALVAFNPTLMDFHRWLIALLLTALAGVAEGHPIHLTHKTSVNVGTAVYLTMLILLPWQVPAVLALAGAGLGQLWRIQSNPALPLAEPLFNVSQVALYVAAGSLAVGAMHSFSGVEVRGGSSELFVIIVASIVLHLTNTGLVAGAAALQIGVSPIRVWRQNLTLDIIPHVALTVLGAVAAELTQASVLFLPTLAAPVILVHRAVAQTVRLRDDTHDALASLVEVVELRDPYTAGHSHRVAATARLLALRLGMTAEEADVIESAGRVHDLGKVAIDPAILTKTSKLTEQEWEQMKLHPVHSANVVERFAAYQGGAAFVRYHHEAWDGSGYPAGLRGDAIPIGARILAVADTFDALTSDRPYRDGMTVTRAQAILEAGAGQQWDARIVSALLMQLGEAPADVPLYRRCALAETTFTAPTPLQEPVSDAAAPRVQTSAA